MASVGTNFRRLRPLEPSVEGWLRPRHSRALRAFTVIELLIVVGIISFLTAILLPSLSRAREQTRTTVCLSNLRQIGSALVMYMQDENDQIPWYNPHPQATFISQYAWGGFVAPSPLTTYGDNIDYVKQSNASRPLNRYMGLSSLGNSPIPSYICPSDVSAPEAIAPVDESKSTWQSAGNSYAINWWWMNYYVPSGGWVLTDMKKYSRNVIKRKIGGEGSAFVVIYEAPLHQALLDARPAGGGLQTRGWHRVWSRHSTLFLDAHVENRFMDTRYPFGDGWSIWPAPN